MYNYTAFSTAIKFENKFYITDTISLYSYFVFSP